VKLRAAAGLLFVALALALAYRLGAAPPRHRSEKRSDLIAHEMLETGHWLIPTLGGVARLQKPPLYYWAAAAAGRLGGGATATTLRSVSAVAAFGLAAAVFAWGASALDPARGLGAAAALAAMDQFWISARLGTADMLLVLFATAALFAFERLERTGDARFWPLLSLLSVLAFLTKATAAVVDVAVPILVWLAFERRLGAALRPRALAWLAVTACGALAWYVAVLALVPEAPERLRTFFFVPLGAGHSDLASDHYHPAWWYLPRFLGAAAPAVLLLPLVIRNGWRTKLYRDAPPLRFAALAALSLFAVWSAIPQKGRHYLLPILPFFALLVADAVARVVKRT
jgi:4-amino-4-deoxy-L-arabinose transferase-like glycosyltransferase